jgi:hypothetical protein
MLQTTKMHQPGLNLPHNNDHLLTEIEHKPRMEETVMTLYSIKTGIKNFGPQGVETVMADIYASSTTEK